MCLKLYCECFAAGLYCNSCSCKSCKNTKENEVERQKAIRLILERNPKAFMPKEPNSNKVKKGLKGCSCKRSGCSKKYCECYQNKVACTSLCKCTGCNNCASYSKNASAEDLINKLLNDQPLPWNAHQVNEELQVKSQRTDSIDNITADNTYIGKRHRDLVEKDFDKLSYTHENEIDYR